MERHKEKEGMKKTMIRRRLKLARRRKRRRRGRRRRRRRREQVWEGSGGQPVAAWLWQELSALLQLGNAELVLSANGR